jgi:hypothetical protein
LNPLDVGAEGVVVAFVTAAGWLLDPPDELPPQPVPKDTIAAAIKHFPKRITRSLFAHGCVNGGQPLGKAKFYVGIPNAGVSE